MVDKDLDPDQDEDDAAGQFRPFSDHSAEKRPEPHSGDGQPKSDKADDGRGEDDGDMQSGQAQPDGQGVQAGGDGEDEKREPSRRVIFCGPASFSEWNDPKIIRPATPIRRTNATQWS